MLQSAKHFLCELEEGPEFHLQLLCTASQKGGVCVYNPSIREVGQVDPGGSLASLFFETGSLSKLGAHYFG